MFENELNSLKRLIIKPQKPLSQLCRRLIEIETNPINGKETPNFPIALRQHFDGPLNDVCSNVVQFKEIQMEKCVLSLTEGDNCIFSRSKGPCLVKNVLSMGDGLYLIVEVFEVVADFFSYPMPSSRIHVYNVSQPSRNFSLIPITDVRHKCVCMPYTTGAIASFILIPLLHSM